MTHWFLPVVASLWVVLWLTPLRAVLEAEMALHMAVQLPFLVAMGIPLARALWRYEPRVLAESDWLGIPGLVLVAFVTSFWMLPRMLDRALADPFVDLAKFVSLPLLGGLPLGLSWPRMPGLGRAFVWANFIPKLGAVGALYLAAPTRLCAYYRFDQQMGAGWTLIALAAVLATAWFASAFAGWPKALWPAPLETAGGSRRVPSRL
jgi:hypothetical protein